MSASPDQKRDPMTVSLALAAALSLATLQFPGLPIPPDMRVAVGDLDLSSRADRDIFEARLDTASRAFCARHRALVTPPHVHAAGYCERGMSNLALSELSRETRRLLRSDRPLARTTR